MRYCTDTVVIDHNLSGHASSCSFCGQEEPATTFLIMPSNVRREKSLAACNDCAVSLLDVLANAVEAHVNEPDNAASNVQPKPWEVPRA